MFSYATCFQDVRSPFLQLSDLQEGQYMFQLTVTDSRGQQDSDTVSVTVLPGKTNPLHLSVCMKKNHASFIITFFCVCVVANKAPVAITGPDRQILLPVNSIMLNGSDSTDDQAIISYQWDLIRYSTLTWHNVWSMNESSSWFFTMNWFMD